MTSQTGPDARTAAGLIEEELLKRLGLTKAASTQEVETARDAIVDFLDTAPQDIKAWARMEIAATDEAYALLSDPDADLQSIALARGVAVPATATVAATAAAPAEALEPDDIEANMLRDEARPARPTVAGTQRRSRFSPLQRAVIGGLAVVAVVAVGFGVYNAGASSVPGFNGTPAPEASAGGATLDTQQVATLMQKLQANPKDADTLTQLGDLYFQAQDYATAADWMTKAVAVDPKNTSALLGLAAADFNNGDSAGAEKQWRAVITIDPKNQEAYYGLGFMYLAQDPPDMANVTAMWNKVIEIDPTTDIAKTVQTHLTSFASASPDASGGAAPGSAAPSASESPATSPAASPAPSSSGN